MEIIHTPSPDSFIVVPQLLYNGQFISLIAFANQELKYTETYTYIDPLGMNHEKSSEVNLAQDNPTKHL